MQLLLMPVRSQNVSLQSDMLVERYNMACLDLRVGLPHDHVNDIFVDSKGFIWVSSFGGGVVRYDGYAFTAPFQGDSRSCLGFAEDRCQRLWIAYAEGTVVVDLKKMCRVVPTMNGHDIGQRLQRPTVKVYCDSKGAMWQVARDSIYRYEFDESGCVASISCCPYQGNTPDIAICDIEHNGNVWVSTALGLQRLHVHGNSLQFSPIHTTLQSLNGYFITDLLRQGNRVWIATNEGLHAYDLYNNTLQTFRHSADQRSLPHNHATSLALTDDGQLLVGTLRGICLFDAPRSGFVCWNTTTADCPLPSDFIRCLLNYDGQLWIGTETAGVVKLSPKPLMLRDYVHRPQQPGSLSPHPVNAMYVEPNGTLWVGTVEGGLNRRSEHGDFTHWTTQESALSHNSVSVLTPDDAGHLWIGTWGGGVNVITLADPQRVTHVEMPADLVSQTNYIGSLAYDKYNNALWIGSNDGVFLYDLRTGRVEDPFPHNRDIRGCIGAHIDRSGQLWLGCLSGVCVVDLRSGRGKDGLFRGRLLRNKLDNPRSLVVDKITCFCETKNGTLWLGSNGYGLYRRIVDDDGREHFKALTEDDGLANNSVKGIVEDEQGRLWITTANGLSIYDCRSNTFINYGEREGLLCQRFYWNSAVKGPDGAIFLGSMDGVIEVRGENEEARHPVRLCFTRLLVDNQEVTATNSTMLDADISQATRIRLHESNKSLTISFSTLTYTGDVQGHYRYRMKGFEDEWTILKSDDHAVRYTSLKPGTYTFEVEYISDGQDAGDDISSLQPEGRSVASIRVDVAPYFWKSWWFVLLVVLLLAGMGVLFVRRRIEELRRKETEKLLIPIRKVMEESDDPERLQVSIQNILDTHEHLKKSYVRSVEADKQETLKSQKSFMERATKVMEQHYMDAGFGIEEFASAMGMSRSLVSKRLHAEAGVSTGQFIRNYRLTVAKKLILENMANRNITEIAYKVGFNDPKYFTRCFTHQYGHSPSTYAGEDESGVEKQENR
jgi:ligand-binding sensor domain-containing protein/AraC-like DNA-binding protein